jgi:superfamily I DNA and RNA helicase
MAIDALSEIDITDADIDEIELLLGNLKFDSQRRDILKCMDSIDIQAFPGSGKTTVLIAKLAILAKKWPYSDRGICILSHTNVARNEIETRLGDTAMGKCCHFPISLEHFILFLIPLLVYRGSGPMGIL